MKANKLVLTIASSFPDWQIEVAKIMEANYNKVSSLPVGKNLKEKPGRKHLCREAHD